VLDVRSRILEAIDVVLIDPASMAGGELTGRALELMYAPLIALVGELRDHWWPYGLRPLLLTMLRMVASENPDTIKLPKVAKALSLIKQLVQDDTIESIPMSPKWGNYFPPSAAEVGTHTTNAVTAKGVLITTATAARSVAPFYGVDNVDKEVADLAGENEEAEMKKHDMAKDLVVTKTNSIPQESKT
jgi:hypothetical protein